MPKSAIEKEREAWDVAFEKARAYANGDSSVLVTWVKKNGVRLARMHAILMQWDRLGTHAERLMSEWRDFYVGGMPPRLMEKKYDDKKAD